MQRQQNSDAVSLEATSSGVKLGAEGAAAARLGDALADLLSPFSQAAGFVGDKLVQARRLAAFRAAKKAVELLRSEGITAGQVPPKLLLPWLEGASIEDDSESSTLEDAWAGLLARAVKSSDAAVVSYIDVLKKIGFEEASLLGFFAADTSPTFSQKFYDPLFSGGLDSPNLLIDEALKRLDEATTDGDLKAEFDNLGLQLMCQVIYFRVDDGVTFTTHYFDQHEHAVSNLEHLGLIKLKQSSFRRERLYSVTWFEITKFAFDMFWACRGHLTGRANISRKES